MNLRLDWNGRRGLGLLPGACALAVLVLPPLVLAQDGPTRSAARLLGPAIGYRSPAQPGPASGATAYAAPAAEPEPEWYGLEELRGALSSSSEQRYVDLGRFRGLRAAPGR